MAAAHTCSNTISAITAFDFVDDLEKIVKNIKERKAQGWDLIDPEHRKFGGRMVYQLITLVINGINRLEYVPMQIKKEL